MVECGGARQEMHLDIISSYIILSTELERSHSMYLGLIWSSFFLAILFFEFFCLLRMLLVDKKNLFLLLPRTI